MKIKKSQLKQVIKEALEGVLSETDELQQQLAVLNAKADVAFAAGDREAYEALVDQMIELENTHLDAGGELPLPRHKDQEDPDDYDDYEDDAYAMASAGFGTDEDYGFYGEGIKRVVREELEAVIGEKKKKKSGGKKDACYHKVKSRYDVWPSAYASGALVKCRKVGAKNWGKSTTKEELELYEGEESLEAKIRNALIEEGGAAGMKALKDHTEASEKEIKDAIKGMEDVGLHKDGDYILQDKGEIDVKKTIDEENLHQWFKDGGWVDVVDGDACAREKGETATPKCVSREKRASMSKKDRQSAQRRKRAKDPNQPKKTGAAKPTYVKTDKPKKKAKKEGVRMDRQRLMEIINEELENTYYEMLAEGETLEEAEYQGRKVTLNKPMQGDVKKSKVYVKNEKGNVVKVNFGDPNMKIRKSNPKARKSFRARHNCKDPGPKWKARYWSCKAW